MTTMSMQKGVQPVLTIILVLLAAAAPLLMSPSNVQLFIFWGINILLAQSINLLSGLGGQISLGHAAFYAIGAYVSAIFMVRFGFPLYITILLSAAVNALVGFLVSFPAGRVREFYLAMMTLGFGFVIEEIIKEWSSVTGGVMGLSGIPSPKLGTMHLFGIQLNLIHYYWIVFLVVVLMVWMLRNFVQSYYGRSFLAIHRSELSAASIGISPGRVKQLAYTMSACLAGVAGALYAHLMAYIGANSFGMMQSIEILVMGILGGFGTIIGPILGAGFLTFIANKLQFIKDYQLMIYSLLLVISFLFIPRGFAGLLGIRTALSKEKRLQKVKPISEISEVKPVRIPGREARTLSYSPHHKKLKVEGVIKDFGGLRALQHVSLELGQGTILGLVGPNGSGKSTLVNVISGVYPVTEGKISFGKAEITNMPTHAIAGQGIIRTFQDPHNVGNMTVKENLLLGRHQKYRSGIVSCVLNLKSSLLEEQEMLVKVHEMMELCSLAQYSEELVENLPYGVQRMVEVARAILAEPELLLLDEPAAGLSEHEMQELSKLIRYIKSRGISVILIDHHMEFLMGLIDEVIVLDSGKMIYSGDAQGMQTNQQVIEAYLGVANHA